jgi:hypothetical protein
MGLHGALQSRGHVLRGQARSRHASWQLRCTAARRQVLHSAEQQWHREQQYAHQEQGKRHDFAMGITTDYSRVSANLWLFLHTKSTISVWMPKTCRTARVNTLLECRRTRALCRMPDVVPLEVLEAACAVLEREHRDEAGAAVSLDSRHAASSMPATGSTCAMPCSSCVPVLAARSCGANRRAAPRAGTCSRCCTAWASTPQRPASGPCSKRRALQPHSVLPQAPARRGAHRSRTPRTGRSCALYSCSQVVLYQAPVPTCYD